MPKQIAGIGVGLRREYAKELACTERQIDFIEVMPENWVCFGGRRRQQLEACVERFPSVTHSVSLNIGGIDPLDGELLDATSALLKRLEAPFFTDHVCYSSVRGQPISDLLPLPFTREVIEHTAARIIAARERVGCPLALENATFYSHMPGAEMDEASFLCQLLAAGDCGMLLDVNNVYVNSVNHGFDARDYLRALPVARVRQLHLAGHSRQGGMLIDTHDAPVAEAVWQLYERAVARFPGAATTLERDDHIPPLAELVAELDHARRLAASVLEAAA